MNAARDAWAAKFVAAAVAKQLTLVAVTDHHDYAMLPHVQRAAAHSGLIVLPGMEITCEDAVQVLALVEADSSSDELSHRRSVAFFKTAQVSPALGG